MKNPFTRFEFLWIILVIMIGINMYWSAIIVNPIREEQAFNINQSQEAIEQNNRIIENQNNNTREIERVLVILGKQLNLINQSVSSSITTMENQMVIADELKALVNQTQIQTQPEAGNQSSGQIAGGDSGPTVINPAEMIAELDKTMNKSQTVLNEIKP